MTTTMHPSPIWGADLEGDGSHEGKVLCRCHNKWQPVDQTTFGSFSFLQESDHWCREFVKGSASFRTYEERNSSDF